MTEYWKVLSLLVFYTDFYTAHAGIAGGCGGSVICNADPCLTATCPQNTQAACKLILDECGRCKAVFTVGTRELTDDECNGVIDSGPVAPCPDGSPPVTCAANPCDTATCEAVPNAECRVSRCGSCQAKFYVGQTEISNRRCAGIGPCPPDIPQAGCINAPGQTCLGQTCRMFPDAECVVDGCGGCTVIFVRNGRRLTKEDCDGCPQRSCRPCENAVCPDHPTARCEEERCGICKASFYGPDHRKKERCCDTIEVCADGSNRFRCSKNPCVGATCTAVPGAICQPDYCGGCKRKFVLPARLGGTEISEEQCKPLDFCPGNAFRAKCDANMCRQNPCRRYPGAICKIDGCNGCKVIYYYDGRRLTDEDCNGCQNNDRVQTCGDPCNGAVCGSDSSARCESQVCGQCRAKFYGVDRRETNCGAPLCSGGLRRFRCRDDPCQLNSCPGVPNAECRSNYCGGCHAEFYYPGSNRRVLDYECAEKEPCPGDIPLAGCISGGPGQTCLGETCPNYPEAQCYLDTCGGCSVAFYAGRRRLTFEDCHGCPQDSVVKMCVNPCKDAICALYPTARCEPRFCGQCGVVFYGLDRREIVDCCTANPVDTTVAPPVTTAVPTPPPPPACTDPALSSLCESDPCAEAICIGRPSATCKSNYCTCTAEFYANEELVTKEECDTVIMPQRCPSSAFPPRPCRPCEEGARCPEVTGARCEERTCRMCKAVFFGQDNTEIQSCCQEGERCADGTIRFHCMKNPCDGASCPGNRFATCRPNYCGGCKAEFFSFNNVKLSDADCVLFDPCPPGTPVPGCMGPDLCLGQTCSNYPNAECKLDTCGSCHVVFFNGGKRLTNEDCFGCGTTARVDDCDDPCDGATCPNDPSARCEPRRCGECKAVFYGFNRREVNCGGGFCANGKRRFNCLVDPCEVKSCPGNPGATCRADYCGGCNAVFYDSAGNMLSEFNCVEKEPCPGDLPLALCQGPGNCIGETCPNYPNADCVVDGCNGCTVAFYNGAKRLTVEDCNGCPAGQTVADNCDDPCANALCPLYPTARCEPRRCGTCRVVFFDANREEIKDCCGKVQSGSCANGEEPINCGIVPQCFTPSCPAFPNAKCRSTNCGECREWYEDENGNIVDCDATTCPPDQPLQTCLRDPCEDASCPAVPGASCRANYCGGCKAVFYSGLRILTDYDCIEKPDRCAAFTTCLARDGDSCRCGSRQNVRCVQQYCPPNQCRMAYFDADGSRIPERECGVTPPCANGKDLVDCGIPPQCFTATCPAFPDAMCKSTNCGECRVWHEDENGNVLDCETSTCPPGQPLQTCLRDPCEDASCPAVPSAVCRANYCGGCKAEFFSGPRKLTDYDCIEKPDRCAAFTTCSVDGGPCRCGSRQNVRCVLQFCPPNQCRTAYFDADGSRIPDRECDIIFPTSSGCPPDKPPASCRIDPCDTATCPGNKQAVCRLNFCGGCYPEFYLNGRKLSDIECVERLDRCAAFTTCAADVCNCPAVRNSQCVVQFCPPNQCKPLYFDASGKKLSNVDCGLCEDGSQHVNCGIVPQCRFSTCPAHPTATCRATNCGTCREWWEDGDGNTVDCTVKVQQCDAPADISNGFVTPSGKLNIGEFVTYTCSQGFRRRGNRRRRCVLRRGTGVLSGSMPQCFDENCPSTQGSAGICINECSSNSECGFNRICCSNGCGTSCVVRQGVCPGGAPYTQCFADPCRFASCPAYPDARCVANYCGGCFTDWYRGNVKLPARSCYESDPRCPPSSSLPRVCVDRCLTSADCNFWEACCSNSCGKNTCVGYA